MGKLGTLAAVLTGLHCGFAANGAALLLRTPKNGTPLCHPLLHREVVVNAIHSQATRSVIPASLAQTINLSEFEPLAIGLAEQAEKLIPEREVFDRALGPYIQKLRDVGTQSYLVFEGMPEDFRYSTDRIVDFLGALRAQDIAGELRYAVETHQLTVVRLFDLGMRWAAAMTFSEAIRERKPVDLTPRETFRLWQWLAGQRETLTGLFPLAHYKFHTRLLSIESVVAMSPHPIFPMQFVTETVHHEAENEWMRSLDTLLHDIFHTVRRMHHSFKWMFPGGHPEPYFPSRTRVARGLAPVEKTINLTSELLDRASVGHQAQVDFHHFVFTSYRRYPESVQRASELIWFGAYFALQFRGSQGGNNIGMDPSGAINRFREILPYELKPLVIESFAGGLGDRYRGLAEEDFELARKALLEMAKAYRPAPADSREAR